jgi:hypothetical protein
MEKPKMNQLIRGVFIVALTIALFACDDVEDTHAAAPDAMANGGVDQGGIDGGHSVVCSPNPEEWDTVRGTVETYCGLCHGETPAFGAPYGLLDFDTLVAGAEGERPMDQLIARMRMGDMPPVGQPSVPSAEALALLDWATCGDNTGSPPPGPNPGGFDVTRPVFAPASDVPTHTAFIEFRADNGHIPADVNDQYTCYSFRGPSGGDRFIRRFEPVIDDARVIHHIVIYEVPEGPGNGLESDCATNLSAAVYAWAPGQLPIQFVEGGLTTNDSRRYILEIHYNNVAGHADVADRSGVRIYHSPPEGPAIDMLTVGPDGFRLPPQTRTAVQGSCAVDQPMTLIATMPHMHELGVSLKSTIKRADGTEEDLITLVGWDFDTQLFYDGEGIELRPGDEVMTECVFDNVGMSQRGFGPLTENEMCYNFLFVTPPPSDRRCNENTGDGRYEPGVCAPGNAAEIGGRTTGPASEGTAPTATGGVFPRGDWRLADYTLIFESADIGLAVLDLEETTLTADGSLHMSDQGRIEFDVVGEVNAVLTSGGTAIQAVGISFAGSILEDDPATGAIKILRDCPDNAEFSVGYSYTDGRLTFLLPFMQMASGVALATFELVE